MPVAYSSRLPKVSRSDAIVASSYAFESDVGLYAMVVRDRLTAAMAASSSNMNAHLFSRIHTVWIAMSMHGQSYMSPYCLARYLN